MSKIECDVEDTTVEVAGGKGAPGIILTCSYCDLAVEVEGCDCSALRRKAIEALLAQCQELPDMRHYIPNEAHE